MKVVISIRFPISNFNNNNKRSGGVIDAVVLMQCMLCSIDAVLMQYDAMQFIDYALYI